MNGRIKHTYQCWGIVVGTGFSGECQIQERW